MKISPDDLAYISETIELLSAAYTGTSVIRDRILRTKGIISCLELAGDKEHRLTFSDENGQIQVDAEDEYLEIRGHMNSIVVEPVASNVIRIHTKKR